MAPRLLVAVGRHPAEIALVGELLRRATRLFEELTGGGAHSLRERVGGAARHPA